MTIDVKRQSAFYAQKKNKQTEFLKKKQNFGFIDFVCVCCMTSVILNHLKKMNRQQSLDDESKEREREREKFQQEKKRFHFVKSKDNHHPTRLINGLKILIA